VQDSAALTAVQRRANLAGTFLLDPGTPRPAPGALLVLVDDVVTSGATLTEAAAVLAGASLPGAPPVVAAVVAATPRTSGADSSERDLRVLPGHTGTGGGASHDRLSGTGLRD
jgi:orotate phosphoribosyltransferase